jgi:hypothetical protein
MMMSRCPEPFAQWAKVLAEWAMACPCAANNEFGGVARDEAQQRWQTANSSNFAELQAALGIKICLLTDQEGDI